MTVEISHKRNYWIFHTGTWFAPFVVGDEPKCLDTPIWVFSTISEHLPFSHGYKKILHQLLVPRTQAVLRWYSWLLLLSFVMLMILVLWILHQIQNHLSQNRLGVQLDLRIFVALPPLRHSSYDKCPSGEAKWTFAPFVLVSSITSFLLLTFIRNLFQLTAVLYRDKW